MTTSQHETPKGIGNPDSNPYFWEVPEDAFWRDVYLLSMKRGDAMPATVADDAVAARRLRGRRNFGDVYIFYWIITRVLFWGAVLHATCEIGSAASEVKVTLRQQREPPQIEEPAPQTETTGAPQ